MSVLLFAIFDCRSYYVPSGRIRLRGCGSLIKIPPARCLGRILESRPDLEGSRFAAIGAEVEVAVNSSVHHSTLIMSNNCDVAPTEHKQQTIEFGQVMQELVSLPTTPQKKF